MSCSFYMYSTTLDVRICAYLGLLSLTKHNLRIEAQSLSQRIASI